MYNKLVQLTILISPIVTILTFLVLIRGALLKSLDFLTRRSKKKKIIFNKILEWFNYIDVNLDTETFNLSKSDNIEKDIGFLFEEFSKKPLLLFFNKRFRKHTLYKFGIKKELRNSLSQFYRFARLDKSNVDLGLSLYSASKRREFTLLKIPFQYYWWIIRGNFSTFYVQYQNNWKHLKENESKYIFADIEVPVKILRMYFRL